MDIVAGRNPVREALRGRRKVRKLIAAPGFADSEIEKAAKSQGIRLDRAEKSELDRRFPGVSHQGVAAEVESFRYSHLNEILEIAASDPSALVLLLDGITDPMNMGALVRSAVAFGAAGIVVGKSRSVDVNVTVAKAAAGAVEHARIVKWNLVQAARELKKAGFWLACASSHGGNSFWEADLSGKVALVLGAEGAGVAQGLEKECDFSVLVPIEPQVESLNVSVAGAVLMAEVARRRAR